MNKTMNEKTKKIAGTGLLTAIVVVLQILAVVIKPTAIFSISLVLIPIVVGAALYGKWSGAWLGFAFGAAVLLSGDAALFLTVNPIATVAVVLLKGTLAGLLAGLVYSLIEKKQKTVAVIAAAIICPLVNTGVFLLGCRLFFFDTIKEMAGDMDVVTFMFVGLCGVNFLLEMGVNLVLAPTIVKLVKLGRKEK